RPCLIWGECSSAILTNGPTPCVVQSGGGETLLPQIDFFFFPARGVIETAVCHHGEGLGFLMFRTAIISLDETFFQTHIRQIEEHGI
ncbi:unnamed protein product, partial [Mycena citricolor]